MAFLSFYRDVQTESGRLQPPPGADWPAEARPPPTATKMERLRNNYFLLSLISRKGARLEDGGDGRRRLESVLLGAVITEIFTPVMTARQRHWRPRSSQFHGTKGEENETRVAFDGINDGWFRGRAVRSSAAATGGDRCSEASSASATPF